MARVYTDEAISTLASSLTSGATSFAVATGEGSKFPSVSGGDYAMITLTQAGNTETTWEIVKLTGLSGDTLTVVRAQEGTTAAAWSASDKVEIRITAAGQNNPNVSTLTAATAAISGGSATGLTSLSLLNAGAGGAFNMPIIYNAGVATNNHSLTFDVRNGDRSIALLGNLLLGGNFTTSGNSNLTLTTTASTSVTLPTAGTLAITTLTQNIQSTAYTLLLGDAGGHILHPSADTTARTFTIPANSSVAYDIGTALTFVNQASAGTVTIAITTDTMRWAGTASTGSRTLAQNGMATALKLTSTEWIINGVGLT